MRSRWLPLALFLTLAFATALVGGIATATSVHSWYLTLNKPSWSPPNWIFGPVWSLLFVLMAVATWRVWKIDSSKAARRTVTLYSAQLTLNALWSVLFFGLRRPDYALIDVIALLALLLFILLRFWRSDRGAAALWVPYVAWVGFAAVLNLAIWQLNRV
jgi:benzodiazapine receptor